MAHHPDKNLNDDYAHQSHPITEWNEDDRPREKLQAQGPSNLSKAELLAIILGSGSRNQSAVELAQHILKDHDSRYSALGKASLNDLMQYKGVGEAKAISIAAAMEIGRRREDETPAAQVVIKSSMDAYKAVRRLLRDEHNEKFMGIFVGVRNQILEVREIASGGMTQVTVDLRNLFKMALNYKATAMIVAHNHPSGNPKPSQSDDVLTKRIVDAGQLMNIPLLDHIIVADTEYYSYADENRLR